MYREAVSPEETGVFRFHNWANAQNGFLKMANIGNVIVMNELPKSTRRGGGGGGRKSDMLDAIRALPTPTADNQFPAVTIEYDRTKDGNDFDAWVKNVNSSLRRSGAIPFVFSTTTDRTNNLILVNRLSGEPEAKALSRRERTRATYVARKAAKEAAANSTQSAD